MKQQKCIHNITFGYEATYIHKDYKEFCSDNGAFVRWIESYIPNKIGENFEMNEDDDCIEITNDQSNSIFSLPELHINNKQKTLSRLDKIEKIMFSKGFMYSTALSKNLERDGGGHIHLNFNEVSLKGESNNDFEEKFLKNLYIFMTNNPEFNWCFNNPYDIYAANSYLKFTPWINYYHATKGNQSKLINFQTYLNTQDLLEKCIPKEHPVIFRQDFNSLEFRFFMMPRTKEERNLHFNLAVCIYNYIFKITKTGTKLELKYNKLKELQYISLPQAKKNILTSMKLLGMFEEDIKLIKKIKFPIMTQRYKMGKDYLI